MHYRCPLQDNVVMVVVKFTVGVRDCGGDCHREGGIMAVTVTVMVTASLKVTDNVSYCHGEGDCH
jgi:hypothetical protein